jgi:hypothetical protein
VIAGVGWRKRPARVVGTGTFNIPCQLESLKAPLPNPLTQLKRRHTKMADSRSRSASPARDEPTAKKQKTGGFKWKEKRARDDDEGQRQDSGRLERGYRDRSPRRDGYRERERDGDDDRGGRRDYRDDDRRESNRDRNEGETDSYRPPRRDNDSRDDSTANTAAVGGRKTDPFANYKPPAKPSNDTPPSQPSTSSKEPEKKKKKKPKATIPSEPMIVVNINDRLGTKAAIPCLASDSVKAFKAMVAAHIGRKPHEIMIKRQGERPFKDALTLEDYGVSNGVQLDLELDTGD